MLEETRQNVMQMLKKTIRPEFLNRIDETIMFRPLSQAEIADVVRLQVAAVAGHLAENGLTLRVTDAAIALLARAGYDPEFGARPVKRAIQRDLLNDLSRTILSGTLNRERPVTADARDGHIVFTNE